MGPGSEKPTCKSVHLRNQIERLQSDGLEAHSPQKAFESMNVIAHALVSRQLHRCSDVPLQVVSRPDSKRFQASEKPTLESLSVLGPLLRPCEPCLSVGGSYLVGRDSRTSSYRLESLFMKLAHYAIHVVLRLYP